MSQNFHYQIQPVTQRFVLSESTATELRKLTPNFGFNGLGEVVFRRTYSRGDEDWADVIIRVIQGVFSIRKEHYFRNGLEWNDEEYQKFAREMALSAFHMKWMPPGRGLWMMGTDFVYTKGSMALINCFRSSEKFWTSNGLRAFRDFSDGDVVTVRGRNSWMRATVKCFGKQPLVKLVVYMGTLLCEIYTTQNHRWVVNTPGSDEPQVVLTKDLAQCSTLYTVNSASFNQTSTPWCVLGVEQTNLVEDVWCVQEPVHEEFILESGILTKNCAAVDTTSDLVHAAEWSMDCLMNGVGVGFNTSWRGTVNRPDKSNPETFVVPDSREGWVESVVRILRCYITSKKYGSGRYPVFDYSQVRPYGSPIRGFGGVASGPDPLIKLHKRIEGYLDSFCDGYIVVEGSNKRKPYNEHSRLIADVINAIGCCVVAGNVRRLKCEP